MNEKIPTANYSKRVTIFTANFWKLIAIRGALIQGLSWLLKYQISICRLWRLFNFFFSKRFSIRENFLIYVIWINIRIWTSYCRVQSRIWQTFYESLIFYNLYQDHSAFRYVSETFSRIWKMNKIFANTAQC